MVEARSGTSRKLPLTSTAMSLETMDIEQADILLCISGCTSRLRPPVAEASFGATRQDLGPVMAFRLERERQSGVPSSSAYEPGDRCGCRSD